MFQLRSRGLQTARGAIAYDFNREKLSERIEKFIRRYNAEVYRHKADSETG
jgi:predicted helicase